MISQPSNDSAMLAPSSGSVEHTVYNKDYPLQILAKGKASLDELKDAGQL